ncbi:glycosyl hydrolase [Asanoa ishikariensis]|uniref:PKD domain-containing protein n=1 Tax=Asanoa ishikariensis TaxID=137265 RepID=A0A1H3UZ54_9ACTN|nr:carbohydrate-binding protein [Asanoa ishikariensis]GIF63306.1 glycosyl hydrolase [Asanoa ishikariensis]SDZ67712.1 PKD domain-containing protein [Asanoa ishikariensis]
MPEIHPPPSLKRLIRGGAAAVLVVSISAAVLSTGGTAAAVPPADYQQVTLARGVAEVGEPMSLTVLPDRSVLHTARNGVVRRTDVNGNTAVIGTIPVYSHDEEGLQGIGASPNFQSNRQIFLYYAPPLSTPSGDAPNTGTASTWSTWAGVNRLSRFTLNTDFTINMASEVVTLTVATSRGLCCHVGGDIDFDAAGNLYLSTGDDTNPNASSGYAPIDERSDRNPAYDAQRSSGNTNDLRGKILRITPTAAGGYTIPSGNLFAPGTASTRPEIYAMGFRNPFRMSVDRPTGIVYVGDYGPDAGSTSSTRGPSGQVEFDRVTSPGNYGWPYCTGTNTTTETYNDFNFATNASGAKFACAAGATNNSPNNTGLTTLPAARPAWIRYAGDAGSPSEFGSGSESPMAGPVYRYNAANPLTTKFPQSLDGQFFAGEFGRRWIKPIAVNADGSRGTIDTFPWSGTQIMDMTFGADGSFYVLDYGLGWFGGDANSAVYRIDYVGTGGNRAPIAVATGSPTSGSAPLPVTFSSAGSTDPDGTAITYSWAFGDGTTSTAANPSKTYTTNGTYTATLTVRDPQGATGTANVIVRVGNTAPTLTFTTPTNGRLFSFGDSVPYTVTVTDPEDGTIDCGRVTVNYVLGHDTHGHPITSQTGCSGTMVTPIDGEHDTSENLFGLLAATYTDNGGLTGTAQVTLQPRARQAEHFSSMSGVAIVNQTQAQGGQSVGSINNGDWVAFTPYGLSTATSITARVARAATGGTARTIQVRAGSATGTLLGTLTVPSTGSATTYTDVTANLTNLPSAPTTLYLVFTGPSGTNNIFYVDSFAFPTGSTGGGNVTVQGEAFSSQSGVQVANHTAAVGGQTAGYIVSGDWAAYNNVNIGGATSLTTRYSGTGTGTFQVRTGSTTGPIIGSVSLSSTGSYDTFSTVTTSLAGVPAGTANVYLTFTSSGFDLDQLTFVKP